MGDNQLYSDRFLILSHDTLIVRDYNFPLNPLGLSRIHSLTTGTAFHLSWWELKGMGHNSEMDLL
jgi:hypothetical protein